MVGKQHACSKLHIHTEAVGYFHDPEICEVASLRQVIALAPGT